jgi:hypothetical protein
MSLQVELEQLLEVAGRFGTVPMLLTVDDDGRARASAVSVSWDGVHAMVRAGRRSMHNAGARSLVSLLWPAPAGERFALLVDGEVVATQPDETPGDSGGGGSEGGGRSGGKEGGGVVVVRATSAILHVVTPGSRPKRRPAGNQTEK